MELTVRALFQRHFIGFSRRHSLPTFLLNAGNALALCKTAALGAHVRRCPHGHVEAVWYNSCRHRSCPGCSALDIERWLKGRTQSLLDCSHYHLVFTIPSELNELWRYNSKLFTELLFGAVRSCLFRMLDDRRYLAATPGILAVLHTWGRTLCFHPHLHCLVTGGGLDKDGTWQLPRRDILLPCRPLGQLFRGEFLHQAEMLVRANKLSLPPDMRPDDALRVLQHAAKKTWTPRVQERYAHGDGVARYLARYVKGGPFRNSSLLAVTDDRVTFAYRNWRKIDDHGKPSPDVLTLSVDDFVSRLLSHIPAPNTRTVRGWGLYAHTQRLRLEQSRSQLPVATDRPQRIHTARPNHPLYCQVCGTRLIVTLISRSSDPLLTVGEVAA